MNSSGKVSMSSLLAGYASIPVSKDKIAGYWPVGLNWLRRLLHLYICSIERSVLMNADV